MSLIIKQYLLVIIIAQFAIFWAKVNKKFGNQNFFKQLRKKLFNFHGNVICFIFRIMMLSNKIVLLHFKYLVYD